MVTKTWPLKRMIGVGFMLLAVLVSEIEVPTSLLIYATLAVLLDVLDAVRDADLDLMLERGRQCMHHIPDATRQDAVMATGPAYMALCCGLTWVAKLVQLVAIFVFAFGPDLHAILVWLAMWRTVAAVGDWLNETGRAAVIYLSYETGHVNAQIGSGPGRYRIASPHPNWSPLHGYRFWAMTYPVTTQDFGPNMLDDED
jgi:hypothetical protein